MSFLAYLFLSSFYWLIMFLKKYFLLIFIPLFVFQSSFAQGFKPKIIPFTGVDYIRLLIDSSFVEQGNTFKILIKSVIGDNLLFKGDVKPEQAINEGGGQVAFLVRGLKPELWMPNNPYLYNVTLQKYKAKTLIAALEERAGFRSFERRGEQLFLNGKPIFLRGIAINPPGRGVPDKLENTRVFAEDYVRFMKSINVNIIRISDSELWFDVCDELGMMTFGGNYGSKVAGGEKVKKADAVGDETDGGFPSDYNRGVAWYENEKLGSIAHHPSLMIYAMTNETPFKGERAVMWEKFLDYAFHKLKTWDETRVYIANAGYGYGKTGDICDLHRYWGWYYSSPYTFLNVTNNANIIPFANSGQPVTFSECVGNYTGPNGQYNQTPGHKNPSSQLTWTGHEREDLQAGLADKHQSFTFRQATETLRQLRDKNPALSGVFPFTILFYNWDTVESFVDMKPKPVTDQTKLSYQPVLLSWECWTSNLYAGATFKPIAHIINDDNDFKGLKGLKLVYQIFDHTRTSVLKDTLLFNDLPYYATTKKQLQIKLPENLVSGNYTLEGSVFADGKKVSTNMFTLFIADKFFKGQLSGASPKILLYDSKGETATAFQKLSIAFNKFSNTGVIAKGSVLVVGENSANDRLVSFGANIKNFVSNGGRVLVLRQDTLSRISLNKILPNKLTNTTVDIDNPVYPVSKTAARNGFNINPERADSPVFSGIKRENLLQWSDYSGWNQNKPGMPQIYPVTDAFKLEDDESLSSTTILADLNYGLQSIALAEQFVGDGSFLIAGFDLAKRADLDPVSDKVLINLINYGLTSEHHQLHQLITEPIKWGDYASEKGLIVDSYNGFLANSTPKLTDAFLHEGIKVSKEGYQLAGGKSARFNSDPGLQYVLNGRRPWGPYNPTYGGAPFFDRNSKTGTAKFWCSIPKGQNRMATLVWNPANEPLKISIKVNDLEAKEVEILPGEKQLVYNAVDSENVKVVFESDRRLVILETTFLRE